MRERAIRNTNDSWNVLQILRSAVLPQSTAGRITSRIIFFLLFAYLVIVGSLAWAQASLIYNPTYARDNTYSEWTWHDVPGKGGHGAYMRKGDPDKPVAIFYHGRSQGMWSINQSTRHYAQAGWTILAPEYPGFAGRPGYPSEEALDTLADAIYDDVIAMGYTPDQIIIQGNSLGAGPALSMASNPHRLLVLTAPVASMAEIIDGIVPFFPSLLLYNGWDNLERAKSVQNEQSMVFHAQDDSIVPYEHGKRLAAALDAQFTSLETGNHFIGSEVGKVVLERLDTDRN